MRAARNGLAGAEAPGELRSPPRHFRGRLAANLFPRIASITSPMLVIRTGFPGGGDRPSKKHKALSIQGSSAGGQPLR